MAKATKICRVCGKEYEACHTVKPAGGAFRWQEVSCSPECGSIYLARIKESRNNSTPVLEEVPNPTILDTDLDIEEDEEELEEDFFDEEEEEE